MIQKILKETCIGYNEDNTQTYNRHEVLLINGEVEIRYSTDTKVGSLVYLSGMTKIRPYVAQPKKDLKQ